MEALANMAAASSSKRLLSLDFEVFGKVQGIYK
jgi:hypothetical protein